MKSRSRVVVSRGLSGRKRKRENNRFLIFLRRDDIPLTYSGRMTGDISTRTHACFSSGLRTKSLSSEERRVMSPSYPQALSSSIYISMSGALSIASQIRSDRLMMMCLRLLSDTPVDPLCRAIQDPTKSHPPRAHWRMISFRVRRVRDILLGDFRGDKGFDFFSEGLSVPLHRM